MSSFFFQLNLTFKNLTLCESVSNNLKSLHILELLFSQLFSINQHLFSVKGREEHQI